MQINIIKINNENWAEVTADEIILSNTQDALDIMANCDYQGARNIILHQENITPDFFELRTKIAGDIFQKIVNYKMRLVIIGDFKNIESKSLRDFIYETNKGGQIMFVNSIENIS